MAVGPNPALVTLIWLFGHCILAYSLSERVCSGGRQWTTCGTCERKCDSDPGMACAAVCQRKCECPRDRPVWHRGQCIQQNQCPSTTPSHRACTGGRQWTTCGTCTRTCASAPGMSCAAVCRRKCECPRDRLVWHRGQCIQQNQCPSTAVSTPNHRVCTGGQQWTHCGTCERKCDSGPGMACAAVCQRKCQCPRDRPVWHRGQCIQHNQCPTSSLGGCTGGQMWNSCGSACTLTCGNPTPICTMQCVARCQCPRSHHIWHEGQCVTQGQCPERGRPSSMRRHQPSYTRRNTRGRFRGHVSRGRGHIQPI